MEPIQCDKLEMQIFSSNSPNVQEEVNEWLKSDHAEGKTVIDYSLKVTPITAEEGKPIVLHTIALLVESGRFQYSQ